MTCFSQLRRLLGAGEGGTQCPVRSWWGGDATPRLALRLCVTSRSVVGGKAWRRQPADCAHRLPLCDFTQAEHSLSWEIYTSINGLRHPCQHTDCLPRSFMMRGYITHALQRWKIIPGTGAGPATLLVPPRCHNSQRS